jgi:hypothetical protein
MWSFVWRYIISEPVRIYWCVDHFYTFIWYIFLYVAGVVALRTLRRFDTLNIMHRK